jgi:hypothetical protein
MHARVTTAKCDPANRDALIKYVQDHAIPVAREFAGFAGGHWLVSDDGTKAVTITLYYTAEAVKASGANADKVRNEAASTVALTIESVDTFEVVAQA